MNQPPTILGEKTLSPARLTYWRALAKKVAADVSVVDPDRVPLRTLRARCPELVGRTIYRASTGGKWGKSAQITRL